MEEQDRKKSGFASAIHRRELAFVDWLIPPIRTREQAERTLGYARRGGLVAAILTLVPAVFPPGIEDDPNLGEVEFLVDWTVLSDPVTLFAVAVYLFIYGWGYRRWEAIGAGLAVFVLDYIARPMLFGEGVTLFGVLLGLYAIRCFVTGLRSRRLLDREGDGEAA